MARSPKVGNYHRFWEIINIFNHNWPSRNSCNSILGNPGARHSFAPKHKTNALIHNSNCKNDTHWKYNAKSYNSVHVPSAQFCFNICMWFIIFKECQLATQKYYGIGKCYEWNIVIVKYLVLTFHTALTSSWLLKPFPIYYTLYC